MNDKLQNVLAELADKFGTTVEHLWQVMLRQATINGVMCIVHILIIFIVTYVFYRFVKWFLAQEPDDDSFLMAVGYPIGIMIIGILLGAGWILVVPYETYDALTSFLNPEFWALRQILH